MLNENNLLSNVNLQMGDVLDMNDFQLQLFSAAVWSYSSHLLNKAEACRGYGLCIILHLVDTFFYSLEFFSAFRQHASIFGDPLPLQLCWLRGCCPQLRLEVTDPPTLR